MAKSQAVKDAEQAKSKYDQGWRPVMLWIKPENKPEARRMEKEWRK